MMVVGGGIHRHMETDGARWPGGWMDGCRREMLMEGWMDQAVLEWMSGGGTHGWMCEHLVDEGREDDKWAGRKMEEQAAPYRKQLGLSPPDEPEM